MTSEVLAAAAEIEERSPSPVMNKAAFMGELLRWIRLNDEASYSEIATKALELGYKYVVADPTLLKPMSTAPKNGRFILLAGPSGYGSTPLRFEACRWVAEGFNRWRNHSNDDFTDGGAEPIGWTELPILKE